MTHPVIRVMVVDDSAVIRGIWARIIDAEADMRVVASASNGRMALDVLRRRDIDVVVLDIEMPEMDGLEALPSILGKHPGVRVIMASSLTRQGAEVTLRALALGAADYVTKPSASERDAMNATGRDLIRKVRGLARRNEAPPSRAPASTPLPPRPPIVASHRGPPRVVAVAASTGGPNALTTVLAGLGSGFPLPVLVVQHMPPLFTTMLAERLARDTGRRCVEATDGMSVEGGVTYVAPGDHHMTVVTERGRVVIRLNKEAPENYCRPSADPLFRSVAATFGGAVLAVVLTGMGQDGTEGCRAVVAAGGTVAAQDQASSVVWGMPGSVVSHGLAHDVVPLSAIAHLIDEHAGARHP